VSRYGKSGLVSRIGQAIRHVFRAEITSAAGLAEFLRVYGAQSSWTGIDVSPAMAMRYAPFGTSVRVISETVSQLPMHLYRKTQENGRPGREEVSDHPLVGLLERPNDWQTGQDFWEWVLRQVVSVGNAFALKVRLRGRLVELIPLQGGRVTVEQRPDFSIIYKVRTEQGVEKEFTAADVFHFRGPSNDGFTGVNMVHEYREAIALGLAQDRYAATLFGNSGVPKGFLKHPGLPNQKARDNILKDFAEQTSGDNTNEVFLLWNGIEWQDNAMTSEAAQLLESRKLQRGVVAAILRVALHMVGDLEKANFSSIESIARQFVDYSLMPWIIRLEKAIRNQLMTPADRAEELFVKLNLRSLLRGNSTDRQAFYHGGILDGYFNRNEVRAWEDLDAMEGLDEFLVPMNENVVGETPPDNPAGNNPAGDGPFTIALQEHAEGVLNGQG